MLLGALTYRLVRDYVDIEPVDALELKGKAEPVPAYRLVSVRGGAERPRRLDAPIIGRERELSVLDGVLRESVSAGEGGVRGRLAVSRRFEARKHTQLRHGGRRSRCRRSKRKRHERHDSCDRREGGPSRSETPHLDSFRSHPLNGAARRHLPPLWAA
ncbi:MAG: hypothetical protein H0U46_09970 [Actinobacteria bacterium]|nr:hypothetical protein [Actinomycetota bacterium]